MRCVKPADKENRDRGAVTEDPIRKACKQREQGLRRQIPTQQQLSKGPEDKEDVTNNPETSTGANTKLEQILRKMSKIDRSFMKALLSLAAGAEDNEALLDKLLTEFSKLKSLTLDVTHEVARLQGIITSTQEKKTEEAAYAAKVTGQNQGHEPGEEVPDFFDQQEREKGKSDTKLALIVTSDKLGKDEIRRIIKRRVDPHELGVPEPEMLPGKEGVVVMASWRKAVQRLEDFIEEDEELRAKLTTRQSKGKSLEVKVIGIDEDLGNEEI
ncbi:hypothetical protein MTO96_035758 [Rhipicephalus appendiculatus]